MSWINIDVNPITYLLVIIAVLQGIPLIINGEASLDRPLAEDTNTFSNHKYISVRSYNLSLTIDFDSKTLRGFSIITVLGTLGNISSVVLDSDDFQVERVVDANTDHPLDWELGTPGTKFRLLRVRFGETLPANKTRDIKVFYSTNPKASAFHWVHPEQTFQKTSPFFYTGSVPQGARSLMPCLDTPGHRALLSASIRVKKGLSVFMTSIRSDKVQSDGENDIFSFITDFNIT
jgi:aminopeptidase N